MTDIKPCPFCGSKNIVSDIIHDGECLDCGAGGPINHHNNIWNWNSRKLEMALEAEIIILRRRLEQDHD